MSDVVACLSCGKKNRVPAAASGLPQCAACHAPLPWLTTAADDDFDRVAGESPVPVLVDCGRPGAVHAGWSLPGWRRRPGGSRAG